MRCAVWLERHQDKFPCTSKCYWLINIHVALYHHTTTWKVTSSPGNPFRWQIVKVLMHEQFRLYDWGRPFGPHVVGHKHTGCHMIQPKLTGCSKGKPYVFNLDAYARVTTPCNPRPFLTSVQTAGAHWMAEAVHRFGIYHALFGTGGLKPMFRAVSTVRLCWHTIRLRSGSDGPSEAFGQTASASAPLRFLC